MTPASSQYRVFAKPLSAPEQEAHELSFFPAYEPALTAAAQRVYNDLWAIANPAQSAKELFDLWRTMGDDVFIVPDDPVRPFSATDFVRLIVLQITLDDSHPLILEVLCTDCLTFASGLSSPPKQWTFWVKAPATYAEAPHLIRRATEALYEEMSRSALESEGSRYSLLDLSIHELHEAEFNAERPNHPQRPVYRVKNDGSFGIESL